MSQLGRLVANPTMSGEKCRSHQKLLRRTNSLHSPRRLLSKSVEWKAVAVAPAAKLMEEVGRELTIDPDRDKAARRR
jgi:hypothetical protein